MTVRHFRCWHISEVPDAVVGGCLRFQNGLRWVYRVFMSSHLNRIFADGAILEDQLEVAIRFE
jgi:hypothetical protein